MKYPIYIEKDEDSDYGVTIPDLPGCFSAGTTLEESITNAEEAILTHLEGLMLDSDPIPYPSSMKELQSKFNSPNGIWVLVTVDIGQLSKETKRINITLPEIILSKVDSFANKEKETRSGLLAKAVLEYISQHSVTN